MTDARLLYDLAAMDLEAARAAVALAHKDMNMFALRGRHEMALGPMFTIGFLAGRHPEIAADLGKE